MDRHGIQRKPKSKGIPFDVPKHGQPLAEEARASVTPRSRSSVSSPFAPGRDTFKGKDRATPTHQSRPAKDARAISQANFYGGSSSQKSLSSHMNGVPDSYFEKRKPGSSPASRFDADKAILEDRAQHRNANAHNHGHDPLRRSHRQYTQKQKADQSGGGRSLKNGEAIVISDSEQEDESGVAGHGSDDDDDGYPEQASPSISRVPAEQTRDRTVNRQNEEAAGEMPPMLRSSIQSLEEFSRGEATKRRRISDGDAERDLGKVTTSSKDISTSFFLPMRIAQDGDGDKLQRKVGLRQGMKDRNGDLHDAAGPSASMKKRNTNEARPSEPLRREEDGVDIPEEVVMPLRELCFHDIPIYFGESSEAIATLMRAEVLKLEWMHGRTRHSVSIDLSNVSHIGVSDKHLSAMKQPSGMRIAHFTVKDEDEQIGIVDALKTTGLSTTRPRRQIDIVMFASGYGKDLHHAWLKFSRALEARWANEFSILEQSQITLATSFVEACKNAHRQVDSLHGSPAPVTKARPRARPSVPKDTTFAERPSAAQNGTLSDDENRSSSERRSGSPQRSAAHNPSPPEHSALTTIDSKKETSDEKLFFYPFQGAGAVTVFESDHARLDEGEFLNDTIIAFGLKYLLEKIKERDENLYSQIYVFSSFFYNHIISKGKARVEVYQRVKKWTSKVDIFDKKYLVVPINEHLHWYLAIVVNPFNALSPDQRREYLRRRKKTEADQKTEITSVASPPADDRKEDVDRETDTHGVKSCTSDLGESASSQRDVNGGASDEEEEEKGLTAKETAPSTETEPFPEPHPINVFEDEENAMFQSHDADGDVPMSSASSETSDPRRTIHTVRDLRTVTSDRQSMESVADGLENAGQGKMVGGGDEAKRRPSTSRNAIVVDDDAADRRFGRPSPILTRSRSSAEASPRSLRSNGPLREMDFFRSDANMEVKWRSSLREGAAVCVFDSLSQKHATVRRIISEYLGFELRDKFGIENDELPKLEYIDVAAPKQPNFCDCGLYLLHTFERFFADTATFLDEVIPKRDRTHEAWNADEAARRRKWWQKTLRKTQEEFQMFQQQRKEERRRLKLAHRHAAATAEKENGPKEEQEMSKEEESSTEGGTDS